MGCGLHRVGKAACACLGGLAHWRSSAVLGADNAVAILWGQSRCNSDQAPPSSESTPLVRRAVVGDVPVRAFWNARHTNLAEAGPCQGPPKFPLSLHRLHALLLKAAVPPPSWYPTLSAFLFPRSAHSRAIGSYRACCSEVDLRSLSSSTNHLRLNKTVVSQLSSPHHNHT